MSIERATAPAVDWISFLCTYLGPTLGRYKRGSPSVRSSLIHSGNFNSRTQWANVKPSMIGLVAISLREWKVDNNSSLETNTGMCRPSHRKCSGFEKVDKLMETPQHRLAVVVVAADNNASRRFLSIIEAFCVTFSAPPADCVWLVCGLLAFASCRYVK